MINLRISLMEVASRTAGFLFLAWLFASCYKEDIPRQPDCATSTLLVTAVAKNATGCGLANGSIEATASGGKGPYLFSIDGGLTKQSTGTFSNLNGGTYIITVYDGNQCVASIEKEILVTGSDFTASVKSLVADSDCLSDNGSVEVQAAGGKSPYSFTLGTHTNATGIFNNLKPGTYSVTVNDAASCSVTVTFNILSESSVSYMNDVAPILTARCNFSACHGASGPQVNLTIYTNVKARAADIKTRIMNGSMPKPPKPGGDLTSNELMLIVCWIDNGALNN
jgi:hypothetical protein